MQEQEQKQEQEELEKHRPERGEAESIKVIAPFLPPPQTLRAHWCPHQLLGDSA